MVIALFQAFQPSAPQSVASLGEPTEKPLKTIRQDWSGDVRRRWVFVRTNFRPAGLSLCQAAALKQEGSSKAYYDLLDHRTSVHCSFSLRVLSFRAVLMVSSAVCLLPFRASGSCSRDRAPSLGSESFSLVGLLSVSERCASLVLAVLVANNGLTVHKRRGAGCSPSFGVPWRSMEVPGAPSAGKGC
jgi:hypothetical protein